MQGLVVVGHFLLTVLLSLFVFVLWVRLALRYFRVSSLHPVSQVINYLTNPIILPIDHLLGFSKKRISRYDWACLSVLVVVECLKYIVMGIIIFGSKLPWGFVPLYVIADLIVQPCNLLFYAIIVRVVMSWVNPDWFHPIAEFLYLVTEPLLQIGRRIIPNISGFDFSPYIMLMILQMIILFINAYLPMHVV